MKKVTARMAEKYGCYDCAEMIREGKTGAIGNMRCTHDLCPYYNDFKPFKKYTDWVAAQQDFEYGLA